MVRGMIGKFFYDLSSLCFSNKYFNYRNKNKNPSTFIADFEWAMHYIKHGLLNFSKPHKVGLINHFVYVACYWVGSNSRLPMNDWHPRCAVHNSPAQCLWTHACDYFNGVNPSHILELSQINHFTDGKSEVQNDWVTWYCTASVRCKHRSVSLEHLFLDHPAK